MIVDDSAVARGLMARWIGEDPDLECVGSAADGAQALSRIAACDPEVVVLDLEMPVMGGLEALPRLIAAKPSVRVVIASTLTQRGASAALRALELGASDCLGKPGAGLGGAESYRSDLLRKLRGLAPRSALIAAPSWPLRPFPTRLRRPEVLLVGASTGGPQALGALLAGLGPDWAPPILVVQHMPAAFTAVLAESLGRVANRPSVEAADGMTLQPGRIHLAPGDFHLRVARGGDGPRLALDQGAPVNFCRPAVDPLFSSAAAVFGERALGVILTGMGMDGCVGARALTAAGGVVLAQDEGSSVVWGMPGATARAGLASLIKPVPALAEAVRKLGRGERP